MKGLTDQELNKLIERDNSNSLVFNNGNLKIPLEIITQTCPLKTIEIKSLRKKLIKGRQYGELQFLKYLKNIGQGIEILEQCPFIIEDRELWQKITGGLYENSWVFVLDIYIPEHRMAFELDYYSTHTDSFYDECRDRYLSEKYGIITERINGYGYDGNSMEKANKKALLWVKSFNNRPGIPIVENYRNSRIRRFETYYNSELEILDRLRDGVGFYNIAITIPDYLLKSKYGYDFPYIDYQKLEKVALELAEIKVVVKRGITKTPFP